MNKNVLFFWLDGILAVGFALAFASGTAAPPLHAAIGGALGVGVVIHLILHWKWIVAMSKAFFKKLPGTVRFKLILNILSLFAYSLTIVSGLMISPTVSGQASAEAAFERSDFFNRDGLLQRQAGRRLTRPALQHGDWGFHWHVIHHASALLTLLTVALHLALHWKWIVGAAKHFAPKPLPAREPGL